MELDIKTGKKYSLLNLELLIKRDYKTIPKKEYLAEGVVLFFVNDVIIETKETLETYKMYLITDIL